MYEYRSNMVIMDIECYPNYFLIAFRDVNNPKRTKHFEMRGDKQQLDTEAIRKWLRSATIITFNGNHYDMPMVMYALTGASCSELKESSDAIIIDGMKSWEFMKAYDLKYPQSLDHIDIFEIPAGTLSLKAYSARIGCKKLQDLPIDPDKWLTEAEMDAIALYCNNDTMNTLQLFTFTNDKGEMVIKQAVDLRAETSQKYGMDLRSKSDAQFGEAVFKSEIEKVIGKRLFKPEFHTVKKKFKYDIPDFIYFDTPVLQDLLDVIRNTVFRVKPTGHVEMPESLSDFKIQINQGLYTIGIGGLHSNESGQSVVAADDEIISDADVASYYPSIIINGRYYPANCGLPFLRIYTHFRDERVRLKHVEGMELICQIYKIALNGSFGKLSSMYSFLYDPKMLIQVTLTGQLSLLMLIERIEALGARIISANTDGIVIHAKKAIWDKVERVVALWEIDTNFTMEFNPYSQIHSQSVNSYLALTTSGKWKQKGDFAKRGLTQSGNNQVCIEAIKAYLKDGTPIRETIEQHDNFLDFTNFQQVKGGAYKDGGYLGKVVRWYYSTNTSTTIVNAKGNNVPLTKGAMPVMDLPDATPTDIDFDWYVREAYDMLAKLGVQGVEREKQAFGLSDTSKPRWGRKDGQQTWHLIDMATKDAMCEARLKDRHDDWIYADGMPITERVCGKCKKKL